MKTIAFYIALVLFLYPLLAMPLEDGSWKEYLLVGASLGMSITALLEKTPVATVPPSRTVLASLLFAGFYTGIFYAVSDASPLELLSLGLLWIPTIKEVGRWAILKKS